VFVNAGEVVTVMPSGASVKVACIRVGAADGVLSAAVIA
jgi:hypothetical protein